MGQGKADEIVKALIANGTITTFRQIFAYLPKTKIAKHLEMDSRTLNSRLRDLGAVTLEDFDKLSELLDIEASVIMKMAHDEYKEGKKPQKKSTSAW